MTQTFLQGNAGTGPNMTQTFLQGNAGTEPNMTQTFLQGNAGTGPNMTQTFLQGNAGTGPNMTQTFLQGNAGTGPNMTNIPSRPLSISNSRNTLTHSTQSLSHRHTPSSEHEPPTGTFSTAQHSTAQHSHSSCLLARRQSRISPYFVDPYYLLSLVPIMSHTNPVDILITHSFKVHFNIVVPHSLSGLVLVRAACCAHTPQ